jgi:hypothetical protein
MVVPCTGSLPLSAVRIQIFPVSDPLEAGAAQAAKPRTAAPAKDNTNNLNIFFSFFFNS